MRIRKMPTFNIETENTIEVIEASTVDVINGSLVFYRDSLMVAALAPNQWKRMWKVE